MASESKTRFRSRDWFDDPAHIDMTALYLERFMNSGLTLQELRSGKPIIGIAQTGSDLNPCNRVHLQLAERVRAGIQDAGGVPMEFPVHPIVRELPSPYGGTRSQSRLSRAGRNPARLSDRRSSAHHRLRQDHTIRNHGRLDRRYPCDRALGRPNARWLARGRTRRLRHRDLAFSPRVGSRQDR